MERELKMIVTDDGSHSLYIPDINESYHSSHGAYREAIHVFMIYGLEAWAAKNHGKFPIRIFEVGFGTGLNAWLSLVWSEQNQMPVLYHTLEPFPLSEDIYSKLNYTRMDESMWYYHGMFDKIHATDWGTGTAMSPYFNMKKEKATLQEATLYPVDVVFFDAFSPKKEPSLWELPMLEKVVESMNPNGVFVTYCATGQLKRDLKSLGLVLDEVPGPPGKKEMTRGWKQ